MPYSGIRVFVLALLVSSVPLLFAGCGGGSSSSEPGPTSTVSGFAVKTAISGARIKAYYFNSIGNMQELIGRNAPVVTDLTGAYQFLVDTATAAGLNGSPLILQTVGGTMNGQMAPTLEALIADAGALATGGASLNAYLSTSSSVAARLLEAWASDNGSLPTSAIAQEMILLVEQQLGVDLSENPAMAGTAVAEVNVWVDQNLALLTQPENNPAVNDYIDYLVANLGTGALDDEMLNEYGFPVPAAFSGTLADVLGQDPSTFVLLTLLPDKMLIINNSADIATLTATLRDGMGRLLDGQTIDMGITQGTGTLAYTSKQTVNGHTTGTLTSDTSGTVNVQASHGLAGDNTLIAQVAVKVTDMDSGLAVIQKAVNDAIMALGDAMKNTDALEYLDEILGYLGLENIDVEGETLIDIAKKLFGDPFPCGDVGWIPPKTVTFTFQDNPDCGNTTGTLLVTPGRTGEGGIFWSTKYDNVQHEDCVIDGTSATAVYHENDEVTVRHTSYDLSLCGKILNGTTSMVYDRNKTQVKSAAMLLELRYQADRSEVVVKVDLIYTPEDGFTGTATITEDDDETVCAFTNIKLDPECGLPTQGNMTINGFGIDFSETSCENPMVTVTLFGNEVELSVEQAKEYFTDIP